VEVETTRRIDVVRIGPAEHRHDDHPPRHVRLEFARGFVRRVEFRHWTDCDHVLPLILADQPLCEPGIQRIPRTTDTDKPAAFLFRSLCGPVWDLVEGADAEIVATHDRGDKTFFAGPNNDAPERARRALADALKRRCRDRAGAG
jgi:hypothetical protein